MHYTRMNTSRKQFLSMMVRYMLLALIAFVSGLALLKSSNAHAGSCPPGNVCQGCNKAKTCTEKR